jgi:hypothetical protein
MPKKNDKIKVKIMSGEFIRISQNEDDIYLLKKINKF